jgi:hypothetical protein
MAQSTLPYNRSVAITPSDTVNFDGSTFSANAATKAIPCEAIEIGLTGNIAVVAENGVATTLAVTVGQILPFKAIRVNSTGTTATGNMALYTV